MRVAELTGVAFATGDAVVTVNVHKPLFVVSGRARGLIRIEGAGVVFFGQARNNPATL